MSAIDVLQVYRSKTIFLLQESSSWSLIELLWLSIRVLQSFCSSSLTEFLSSLIFAVQDISCVSVSDMVSSLILAAQIYYSSSRAALTFSSITGSHIGTYCCFSSNKLSWIQDKSFLQTDSVIEKYMGCIDLIVGLLGVSFVVRNPTSREFLQKSLETSLSSVSYL